MDHTKTKIVSTIGPASEAEDKIRELVKAGVSIFRLNTSHDKEEVHKKRIETIRKVSAELKTTVGVLVDLQRPKIRVGNLKEPKQLENGQIVKLKPSIEEEEGFIPVDYFGIVEDVAKGDRILLDDGKLELRVVSTHGTYLTAEVVHGGLLKKRKGLNIPGSTASLSAVTERDVHFIKFAVENNADYVALSFVRERDDILKAKQYIKDFGGNIPVVAKIEKPQAVKNLNAIITAADAVMVARGDLGIELSIEEVPIVQKQIVKEANAQRKGVIVATQMLESMIEQPLPTRAEASDVANAIIDGADAVMLSGETAMGAYPVEAVSMMTTIAGSLEKSKCLHLNHYVHSHEVYDLDSQAICSAIIQMLDTVEVSAIVAFTKTGYTARMLSKAKPSVPIIAFTHDQTVCNRLNLFWDVYPRVISEKKMKATDLLAKVDEILIKEKSLNAGDKVLITGGMSFISSKIGRTNFIKLHQIGATSTIYAKGE